MGAVAGDASEGYRFAATGQPQMRRQGQLVIRLTVPLPLIERCRSSHQRAFRDAFSPVGQSRSHAFSCSRPPSPVAPTTVRYSPTRRAGPRLTSVRSIPRSKVTAWAAPARAVDGTASARQVRALRVGAAYFVCKDPGGGGCACVSDDPTGCIQGCNAASGASCQSQCAPNEYAMSCGQAGGGGIPRPDQEPPDARVPTGGIMGLVFYCCPCE